jgi:hypothetical protein
MKHKILVKPSTTAHILTAIMAFSSIVIAIVLLVQLFREKGRLEYTWDRLALWIDESLD